MHREARLLVARTGCRARNYFRSVLHASIDKGLRDRIRTHCSHMGQAGANGIDVSTVHAPALRTLRRAGLLTYYPVDPLVLDDWELTNIFDAEFGARTNITSKVRREEIRRYHEAFWSTGKDDLVARLSDALEKHLSRRGILMPCESELSAAQFSIAACSTFPQLSSSDFCQQYDIAPTQETKQPDPFESGCSNSFCHSA
jgi:hypothetical protein